MKKIIPFKKEIVFKTNISEITSISLEHQLSINDLNITGEFMVSGDYKVSEKSTTVEPFDLSIPFEIVMDEKYDTSKAICDIDDFYYEIVNNSILVVSIDVCVDKLAEILIKPELPVEKVDIIEELFEEQNKNRNIELSEDKVLDGTPNVEDLNCINNHQSEAERCVEEEDIKPGEEKIKKMEDVYNIQKLQEEIVKPASENYETITKYKEEIIDNVNDKINSLFSNVGDGDVYVSYNVYIIRDGDTIESVIEKYGTTEDDLKKYNNLSDLKLGDKLIIPTIK